MNQVFEEYLERCMEVRSTTTELSVVGAHRRRLVSHLQRRVEQERLKRIRLVVVNAFVSSKQSHAHARKEESVSELRVQNAEG